MKGRRSKARRTRKPPWWTRWGRGDGFAAGVLSALREGLSLREAVRRGNAIGTIQIQHEGDNEGLPTREALEEFMTHTPLKTAEEASL